jgi:ERCC4-related helicase
MVHHSGSGVVQVIVYLETGTGKTLIGALLAKHFLDENRSTNGASEGRPQNIVCLEPTTILVGQQASVFRKVVQVPVGEYTGSHGVDSWSREKWEAEYRFRSFSSEQFSWHANCPGFLLLEVLGAQVPQM